MVEVVGTMLLALKVTLLELWAAARPAKAAMKTVSKRIVVVVVCFGFCLWW
jgi:hypothetical protein